MTGPIDTIREELHLGDHRSNADALAALTEVEEQLAAAVNLQLEARAQAVALADALREWVRRVESVGQEAPQIARAALDRQEQT